MRITSSDLRRLVRQEINEASKGSKTKRRGPEAPSAGPKRPRKVSVADILYRRSDSSSEGEQSWDDLLAKLADCLSSGNDALRAMRSVARSHEGSRRKKIDGALDEIKRGLSMINEASIVLEDA